MAKALERNSSRAARSRPGAVCCARTRACSPSSIPSSSGTHGLAVPEYEVLLVLTRCGDKHLRMSELADAALLTRSGMTRLVDRLERQGLVRRERCAADGRGTYAVITPEGAARFAEARPTHIAGVRRLFLDPLRKKDQRALAEAFDAVLGEPTA